MFTRLIRERTESTELRSGSALVQEAAQSNDMVAELQRLKAAKQKAVENEEYEEAAILKHRIQSLEHQMQNIMVAATDSALEGRGLLTSSTSYGNQFNLEHEAKQQSCVRQGAHRGAWAAFAERRSGSNGASRTDDDGTSSIPMPIDAEIAAEFSSEVDASEREDHSQSMHKSDSLDIKEICEDDASHGQSISNNGPSYSLQSDGGVDIGCENHMGDHSRTSDSSATWPSHNPKIDFRLEDKTSIMTNLDDELNVCCTSSDSDREDPNPSASVVIENKSVTQRGNHEYAGFKASEVIVTDDNDLGDQCTEGKSEKAILLVHLRRHVLSIAEKDFPRALEQVSEALLAALGEDAYVASMLLRLRIELQRNNGNFDEALADCNHWVKLSPQNAEARFRRAIARLQVGGSDGEALGDLRRAEALGIGNRNVRQFQRWVRRAKHWMSQPSRPNHYYALSAPIEASHETLKRAYRCALLRWHPDKPGGDAARFRSVQEAWDVLGDQDQRKFYDFGTVGRVGGTSSCGFEELQHRARGAYHPFRADAFSQVKARPKKSSRPQ